MDDIQCRYIVVIICSYFCK